MNINRIQGILLVGIFILSISQISCSNSNDRQFFDVEATITLDEANKKIILTNTGNFDFVDGQMHIFHRNDSASPAFLEYIKKGVLVNQGGSQEFSWSDFTLDGATFPENKTPTSVLLVVTNNLNELGTLEIDF